MRNIIVIALLTLGLLPANAQHRFALDGQLSGMVNFSPDNPLELFNAGRYIPQLNYGYQLDSTQLLDLEISANLSGSWATHPFDTHQFTSALDPYRIWLRYTNAQFELRLGLQKIDFGSASMMRPLQWFNQIDPRDPLQLTNGVYGLLAKYHFLNNANIWLWGLYGNDKTRGFDALPTVSETPEFGGRVQLPTPRGEVAFSYNRRQADPSIFPFLMVDSEVPEDRYALDGKWDVGVGLWLEATYIQKHKDLGLLSNQSMLNVGVDYTFGIGNGLNVMLENLMVSTDSVRFQFEENLFLTAVMANYPLAMFDNISFLYYRNWAAKNNTIMLNYMHQFTNLTTYLLAYYNPTDQQGILQNELVYSFGGPGIRLMLVYNH